MNYIPMINEYINAEINVIRRLDLEAINNAMNLLEETRKRKGTIYIFGNGGSSATASHIQNDFNKGVSEKTTPKYRFICLNDNIPTLMALANDNGFDNVFVQQLENYLEPNDLVVAISGSGNSANVIKAVEYAKENGVQIIGLTGFNGGKLSKLSDISLNVPVNDMQITEDIHMIFDHMMMRILCSITCDKKYEEEKE